MENGSLRTHLVFSRSQLQHGVESNWFRRRVDLQTRINAEMQDAFSGAGGLNRNHDSFEPVLKTPNRFFDLVFDKLLIVGVVDAEVSEIGQAKRRHGVVRL